MVRYSITVKGLTPLLHHKMPEDELLGLLGTKSSRKKDKVEQTPREIADKYAYKDNDGCLVIPTTYLVGAFKSVAGDYKQANSIRKSIKSIAGGIFRPENEFERLHDDKNNPIKKFEVDLKKATNHQKGAVAVCRPRMDKWNCTFTVTIDESLLSSDMVLQMLNDAGKRSGIGSFRVSKGGHFGQFAVTNFKKLN